ncbi:MAG TPA: TonB family protein [Pyrinomonadaceae bacterium]
MLKSIIVLVILALATLDTSAMQGAGQKAVAEDDRLNAEVIKLYREGKYDEALPIAKRVLELREQAPGGAGLKLAYALTNLANIYARKGLNKEAEPLFTRALVAAEKGGAAETDFAADLHAQLGLLSFEKGRYGEAETFLQRALDIREKMHGAEDARLVPALLNLADVNFLRTQPEKAHALLGRALSVLKRQPYAKDVATAKRLKNYYCPLMGAGPFNNRELVKELGSVVRRLEEPERAEKYDREQKEQAERAARGEVEKKGDKKLVEGGVLNGHAISKPAPTYPTAAKNTGVSGTVVVQILVDESGYVVKAEPFCGHPLLAAAAVEAARKARFTPTLLSGQPVKVSGVITYNFVLQ